MRKVRRQERVTCRNWYCFDVLCALRVCDCTKIQKKDVSHQENGRVVITFEHTCKRRNPGFTYHVPSLYSKLFKKYKADLPAHLTPEEQYLRLWVKKDGARMKEIKWLLIFISCIVKFLSKICSATKSFILQHAVAQCLQTAL